MSINVVWNDSRDFRQVKKIGNIKPYLIFSLNLERRFLTLAS